MWYYKNVIIHTFNEHSDDNMVIQTLSRCQTALKALSGWDC